MEGLKVQHGLQTDFVKRTIAKLVRLIICLTLIPHSTLIPTDNRIFQPNPTDHQDTSKLLSVGSQQIIRSCHGKGLTIQATNILTTRRHQGQLVPDLRN